MIAHENIFIYADFFHKLDSGFFFFCMCVKTISDLSFMWFMIAISYQKVSKEKFFGVQSEIKYVRWFIIHNLTE